MDHYETRDSYPELEGAKPVDFDKSEIRRIFKGAIVFVTGGAGFLGSLLIEKIARSCPDFGKIYLLLRPKRGLTAAQRLKKLFDDEIYDLVKKTNPEFASRVFLMEGDINEPICGLSLENQNIIREEVHFVYHIAASLNMAAPLKAAYNMNIRATKDLLELGTEMKHLKGFIYVSTAYSNCFRPDISETFYPTTYNWEHLRDLAELMSEEEMSYLAPKLLGEWVNTYAFTKALSEDMVKSYVQKIPVAVARPSIVVGCWMEPLRGWVNNVYGAVGVAAGSCVGIIRVWYCDKSKTADIIPADYVVNTMIAIAWKLAKNHREKVHHSNPVYNIVSSPKAPITWDEYMNQSFKAVYYSRVFATKGFGEFSLMLINRRWLFTILFVILHMSQTLLFDTILILKGKSPVFKNLYIKMMRLNLQLAFFGEREWNYEQNNVNILLEEMTQEDKTIFPFDMATFSWKEYNVYSTRGIYKYIVKEKNCEQPKAGRDRYLRAVALRRIIMRIGSLFIWCNILRVCSYYTTAIIISLSKEMSLEKTMIT